MDPRTFTSILVAYAEDGTVLGTLDFLVRKRPDGRKELIDFVGKDARGEPLDSEEDPGAGLWHVPGAKGSKPWPERVAPLTGFRVELDGPPGRKSITALVHRSGVRRNRANVEAAIEERLGSTTREAGGRLSLRLDAYLGLLADVTGLPDEPIVVDPETGEEVRRPERRG
jgi:hypothetical protein